MTITNGYTTVARVKDMLSPVGIGTSGSVADDAFLERLIEETSRWIDQETGRQFFTTAGVRKFDLPDSETLYLDADLTTSGCVVNGDGLAYSGSSLRLMPTNLSPKYAIEFKDSVGAAWQTDANGDDDECIQVSGSWGYTVSGSAPLPIQRATEEIVKGLYLQRAGQGVDGDATITAAGVVITPRAIPASASRILGDFRRTTLVGA